MTDVRTALRWGAWLFAGVTLLVPYRSAGWEQRAAYLTSLGAWAAAAGPLAWRRCPWPLTAAVAGVTLGATVCATLALPAAAQHTSASWAVAVNGWVLLTLASGGRLGSVVLLLTVPVAVAVVAAVPAGPAETVPMAARGLGILGLQVPVALAVRAVARSADTAAALRLMRETIRTDQVVATSVHEDRLRRSRAVAAVVEPILAILAEAPDDESSAREGGAGAREGGAGAREGGVSARGDGEWVRRRSGVAAAQVRRLLAEWDRGESDDLSACLDEVQAAGVRVEVAMHAGALPPALRRTACAVVRDLAGAPATRLRVTVVPTATHLRLSVVARVAGGTRRPPPAVVPAPLAIRTTTAADSVWVELTCPLAS